MRVAPKTYANLQRRFRDDTAKWKNGEPSGSPFSLGEVVLRRRAVSVMMVTGAMLAFGAATLAAYSFGHHKFSMLQLRDLFSLRRISLGLSHRTEYTNCLPSFLVSALMPAS